MPAECVRYLPASYIAGDPLLPLVTLRHALSHTSGLPHWTDRGRVPQVYYEPGRCFAYSSPGIDCLQKVVKQRGDTWSYNACVAGFRDEGTAVVVLTNGARGLEIWGQLLTAALETADWPALRWLKGSYS